MIVAPGDILGRCRALDARIAIATRAIAEASAAQAAAKPIPPLPANARVAFTEDWSTGAIDPKKWYVLRKKWGDGNHGVVPENVAVAPFEFMVCRYQPASFFRKLRRPLAGLPRFGLRPRITTGSRNGMRSCCRCFITATLKNARSRSNRLILRPNARTRSRSRAMTTVCFSRRLTHVYASVKRWPFSTMHAVAYA